jgi:preprotein translocase subunit Sec61beta
MGNGLLPVSLGGEPKKPKLPPALVYAIGAAAAVLTFVLVR